MSSVPALIVLDWTLQELYASESYSKHVTLVYAVPTAEVQMAAGIPISKKFAYQAPDCPTNDSDTLARVYLELISQLFGFVAGKMPLIMFNLDADADQESTSLHHDSRRTHEIDAFRMFDCLAPSQQPNLTFVAKPSDIQFTDNTKFAIVSPMDCLHPLPNLVDPESHYEVLSKRGLARSGLPTPDTDVIDTLLSSAQITDTALVNDEAQRMHISAAYPLS